MTKLLIKVSLFLMITLTCGCSQDTQLRTDAPPSTISNDNERISQSSKQPTPAPSNSPYSSIDRKISRDASTQTPIKCSSKELSEILTWLLKNDGDVPFGNMDWECSDYIKIGRHFDLNGDGIKEIFVTGSGAWGAVSTLPIWVMKKKKNGYAVLLKEQGEQFYIKKTSTNGYRDLFFPSRRNIASTFLSTYKFKKNSYYKAKCRMEFYDAPKNIRRLFNCADEKEISKFEEEYRSSH